MIIERPGEMPGAFFHRIITLMLTIVKEARPWDTARSTTRWVR